MSVSLAGQDQSADLDPTLDAAAQQRPDPDLARRLTNADQILALRSAQDEADFQNRLVAISSRTAGIELALFDLPPPRSALEGFRRRIRQGLWRVLRYLFDWLMFRQNTVNHQIASSLEFQNQVHRQAVEGLQTRLARLESALTASSAPPHAASDTPAEPAPSLTVSDRIAPRFDQLLAGYADGDAISQDARHIRARLRAQGIASDIFAPADRIGQGVRDDCRPLTDYAPSAADTVLYHAAIASPTTEAFLTTPARRLARYHNITPSAFFEGYDDDVTARLTHARSALHSVLSKAAAVFADSDYNAQELCALGLSQVQVMPLFFSPDDFRVTPDPDMLNRFTAPLTNILFVGRIAPNKCIEDLMLAFAWYQRANPFSRLIIVGSEASCPRYALMLRMLAAQLELPNVCFTGFVSDAARAACYQLADVFVCTSRHEGYCLPLIEAMTYGVPVISRSAGGTPEALDGAGVMFDELDPPALATLIGRVLNEPALHDAVMASQSQRLKALRARDLDEDVRRLMRG